MVTRHFLLVYHSIFHSLNRLVCVCVCVKFHLGQNEDCSMGGSISVLRNCSKEAVGGRSTYKILVKAHHSPNSLKSIRFSFL